MTFLWTPGIKGLKLAENLMGHTSTLVCFPKSKLEFTVKLLKFK